MMPEDEEQICDLCRDFGLCDCDKCENNSRKPLDEAQQPRAG